MSQVIVEDEDQGTGELPQTTHGTDRRGRAITRTLVVVGFALIVALFFLLLFSTPVENASRIALGPVSLNTFFMWLGGLHPLLQIPVVLLAFGVVVAIVLVLIEYAPRPGKGYFIMRLVACLVIPVLAFMLLRPYSNAVLYVVGIALVSGALLFFADYRSRQGAGYLFQLILFMAPAAIMLLMGLIYPAVATFFKSFFDKTGKEFVGFENYVWVFTNPVGTWSVINTLIWALLAPTISVAFGLAYAVFIDRARGEKVLKVLVFMPVEVHVRLPAGRPARPAECDRDDVRRRPRELAGGQAAAQHDHAADRLHLDPDRVRDGDPLRRDQGRPRRAARGC
jgi:alpha-glucoside transport system permease protein